MNIEKLRAIEDEAEQVEGIYQFFNEDTRLNRSRAARVEFLTTVKYIEQYMKPGSRILDIGAGAGEYSLYFAEKGYSVTALELTDTNIEAFRRKILPEHKIDLRQGNALDLSDYDNDAFDVVLLFGPLYHLRSEADRQQCIAEAVRVCKADGILYFSFISNDMVFLTELAYNEDYFRSGNYGHETFKLEDFPFVFFTLDQCRDMLQAGGINVLHEVASDGVSELLADQINRMDEYSYRQYLKYHFYCCEKPEMLGRSNHLLFIGKANGQ